MQQEVGMGLTWNAGGGENKQLDLRGWKILIIPQTVRSLHFLTCRGTLRSYNATSTLLYGEERFLSFDFLSQSRKNFAGDSKSDHVALLNAYNGWLEAMSRSQGKQFVQQRFLHWGTLNMIRGRYQVSTFCTNLLNVPSSSLLMKMSITPL